MSGSEDSRPDSIPQCPRCGQLMQFSTANATTDQYICGCNNTVTYVNVHRRMNVRPRSASQ